MPLLLIPIFLIIIGVVMIAILGLVFGLIHLLFWPVVIGLLVWWLVRRTDRSAHRHQHHYHTEQRHSDWQDAVYRRKEATNVHEESQPKHHDDDWSDF